MISLISLSIIHSFQKPTSATEIVSGSNVRQSDVTHCVCALRCGGLFLPWWPFLFLLLGLFSALCLLTLTAQCPQLLVLLWGKHFFRLMAVQVFLKSGRNRRQCTN